MSHGRKCLGARLSSGPDFPSNSRPDLSQGLTCPITSRLDLTTQSEAGNVLWLEVSKSLEPEVSRSRTCFAAGSVWEWILCQLDSKGLKYETAWELKAHKVFHSLTLEICDVVISDYEYDRKTLQVAKKKLFGAKKKTELCLAGGIEKTWQSCENKCDCFMTSCLRFSFDTLKILFTIALAYLGLVFVF